MIKLETDTNLLISVDNSEWMRNGDYMPSRIEAQQDAVNLICGMDS